MSVARQLASRNIYIKSRHTFENYLHVNISVGVRGNYNNISVMRSPVPAAG